MLPYQPQKPLRVCVEGNIGCGKSTVLEALARARPGLTVRQEPVGDWEELLELFYTDQGRWALALSLRVLISFVVSAPDEDVPAVVLERSPLSNRHVFSQLLFNEGKMSQGEWDLYKEYYDVLGWTPDLVVFLVTPADECHRRMVRRARPSERDVDLHYLRRLEFQYETMLRYAEVPVVRVDGTGPPERVAAAVAAAMDSFTTAFTTAFTASTVAAAAPPAAAAS